jgi:hypothetical protein
MSANTSDSSDDSFNSKCAKRSKVWEHYEQNLVQSDTGLEAICKYCQMQLCTRFGTNSLRTHISKYCHGISEDERNAFIETLHKSI